VRHGIGKVRDDTKLYILNITEKREKGCNIHKIIFLVDRTNSDETIQTYNKQKKNKKVDQKD